MFNRRNCSSGVLRIPSAIRFNLRWGAGGRLAPSLTRSASVPSRHAASRYCSMGSPCSSKASASMRRNPTAADVPTAPRMPIRYCRGPRSWVATSSVWLTTRTMRIWCAKPSEWGSWCGARFPATGLSHGRILPPYDNAHQQLTDMVRRDHNRANIIIWSIANETPHSKERDTFRSFIQGHTVRVWSHQAVRIGLVLSREVVLRCVNGDEYPVFNTTSRLLRTEGEHLVVFLAEIGELACAGIHPPYLLLVARDLA